MRQLLILTIMAVLGTCQPAFAQNSLPSWVTANGMITTSWDSTAITGRAYQMVRGYVIVDSLAAGDTVCVARQDDTLATQIQILTAEGQSLEIFSNMMQFIRVKTASDTAFVRRAFY